MWGEFKTNIVAAAKPTEAGAKWKKLPRAKLGRDATGTQLRDARPNSIWTATEFCPWLAVKISKQAKGEAGELLNTGRATLFLVKGVNGELFLVHVNWHSDVREWRVYTWKLSSEWNAGYQFVPRN